MNPQEIAYIIFGVILIASFISVFFFTYVSKVEGDVVKSQMSRIVNDLAGGSNLILTPDQKKSIGTAIQNNLVVPDMSTEDAEVKSNNNKLKKKALKIFGSIVIAGLAVIAYLYMKYSINLTEIVKYSLIILLVVALTEYLFVTEVSKNYEIVDPNYVRYLIMNNFKTYASS
jgi:hypothetical protein